MKTLAEVKQFLADKYEVEAENSSTSLSNYDSVQKLLVEFVKENADLIAKIEEDIGKGVDFRYYFEDLDAYAKLRDMRYSDPDLFYDVIRKEELFLNTLLRYIGCENRIISLNVDEMFNRLDDNDDDINNLN